MEARSFLVLALAGLGLSCAGTEQNQPSKDVVAGIEARLTQVPCIRELQRWHREYAFGKKVNRPVDRNLIHIWYRQADNGHPAGQFIRKTIEEWPIDDSPVDMVFARYDVPNNRLTLEYCGPNWRGAD